MSIVNLACAEQCLQRVIPWDDKSCDIDKEFPSDVEKDKEEVNSDQAEEGVNLRDRRLFLEVVEYRVLGKLWFSHQYSDYLNIGALQMLNWQVRAPEGTNLLIDLANLVLGSVLEGHDYDSDSCRIDPGSFDKLLEVY